MRCSISNSTHKGATTCQVTHNITNYSDDRPSAVFVFFWTNQTINVILAPFSRFGNIIVTVVTECDKTIFCSSVQIVGVEMKIINFAEFVNGLLALFVWANANIYDENFSYHLLPQFQSPPETTGNVLWVSQNRL